MTARSKTVTIDGTVHKLRLFKCCCGCGRTWYAKRLTVRYYSRVCRQLHHGEQLSDCEEFQNPNALLTINVGHTRNGENPYWRDGAV